MDEYLWIIENKDLLKVFYGLLIGAICAVIVVRTDRLLKISLHQGIRYFRNAFFFYGIAFIARAFIGLAFFTGYKNLNFFYSLNFIFEFFIIMAGFFLLYSLLWKRIEDTADNYSSSLFNSKIAIFYAMALIIVLLDSIWQETRIFLFASQIIVFAVATIISFANYRADARQHKFLKFYLIAMILGLTAWILNSFAGAYYAWANSFITLNVLILDAIIFLLFLFGVISVTRAKQ